MSTLEVCLRGDAAPAYYLAALDPGMGKTEAIIAFIRAWKARGFLPEGSIIVCLSRIDEVKTYIDRCGLEAGDLGVRTADAGANALGADNPNQCRVLFTTQQMIASRTRGGRLFGGVKDFQFRGRERSLRIWDETLMPATPHTLRIDVLSGLPAPLRPFAPAIVPDIELFVSQVRERTLGDIVHVPSALAIQVAKASEYGSHAWHQMDGRQREAVKALSELAGRSTVLIKDNLWGQTLVGCSHDLPRDLPPMVILDASGRVRDTYKLWEECRGDFKRLPSAAVDYRQLTVRYWDRSASRTALRDDSKRSDILRVVADMINAGGDDDWLVIHLKQHAGQFNIPEELNAIVAHPDRIKYVFWGNHHGTNAFREVRNVIVLGVWDYATSTYLASHIAATGHRPGLVDTKALDLLRAGETKHNLLQALCRAAVRNGAAGVCGECTAYVIASERNGLSDVIRDTFPGCSLERWQPVPVELSGQALVIAEEVLRQLSDATELSVTKVAVREAVGIRDRSGLGQITRRDDFRDYLSDRGVVVDRYKFTRGLAASQDTLEAV